MKYIIITFLLLLQITAFAQEDNAYIFQTEKKIYKAGNEITAELKSEIPFTLMTTGDCNDSVLAPSIIKQVDGKWQELYAVKQMCCGLPCTMNQMWEMNPQIKIEVAGVYKMIVYTCGKTVVSNAFEVVE